MPKYIKTSNINYNIVVFWRLQISKQPQLLVIQYCVLNDSNFKSIQNDKTRFQRILSDNIRFLSLNITLIYKNLCHWKNIREQWREIRFVKQLACKTGFQNDFNVCQVKANDCCNTSTISS